MNTNVEGGVAVTGSGAVWEMEVGWPSRAALRGEVLNRHELHWLKTVVVSVVGKGVAGPRQVRSGKMSDGCKPSVVDVSKRRQMRSEPGSQNNLGMSLGDTRLLPRRSPAYMQHESGQGSRMERVKACPDTATEEWREDGLQAAKSARSRVPMRDMLADSPVVAVKSLRIAVGVEPRGGAVLANACGQPRREESHE